MSDPGHPDRPAPKLDDYLDGSLPPEERARFEAELSRRPDLARELELQARIDAGLKRVLARPGREAETAAAPHRWFRWYAAAAAIVLVGAAAWLVAPRLLESRVEGVYRRVVSAGFTPEVVCTQPEEFRTWVWTNYQQGLAPTDAHPGVEFVGWSYTRNLGTDLLGTYAEYQEATDREIPVVLLEPVA